MWVLNSNGTLANSYSGLCATVNSVEGDKFVCFVPYFVDCCNNNFASDPIISHFQVTCRSFVQLKSVLVELVLGLQLEEEV